MKKSRLTIQQWKRSQLMLTLAGGMVDCPDCDGEGCSVCQCGRLPLLAALGSPTYKDISCKDLESYARYKGRGATDRLLGAKRTRPVTANSGSGLFVSARQ